MRASSFPVAVLANTGVIGTLLMAAFVVAVLLGSPRLDAAARTGLAVREAATAMLSPAGVYPLGLSMDSVYLR